MSSRRSALVQRVLDTPPGTIITVVASAGFGKSTLVDQIRSGHRSSALLALRGQHDDPTRFGKSLLSTLSPTMSDETLLTMPDVGGSSFVDTALELLEGTDGPDLLILDDMHEVTNATVLETIATLIWRARDKRVIIASRRSPPIGIARLKVRKRLVEIEEPDLMLTEDDVLALLAEIAPADSLTEEVIEESRRLRGWPAGVTLFALSLAHGTSMRSFVLQADLREFVNDEILSGLSSEVRELLLELSLMGVFNGPFVAQVTGRSDADHLVGEVVRNHLFVEGDRTHHGWLRFHDLFSDLLRTQAKELPASRRHAIQVGTVRTLMTMGAVDLAVERMLTVEDSPAILEILQDVCYRGNNTQDDLTLYQHYTGHAAAVVNRIPLEALRDDPAALGVALLSAMFIRGPSRAAELNTALNSLQPWDAPGTPPFLAAIVGLYHHRAGDIIHAIEIFEHAVRSALRSEWSGTTLDYLVREVGVASFLLAGRFADCVAAAEFTLELAGRSGYRSFVPEMHALIGIIDVYQGNIAAAQSRLALADEHLEFARAWWEDLGQTATLRAILLRESGDLEQARLELLGAMSDVSFDRTSAASALQYLTLAGIEADLGLSSDARGRMQTANALLSGARGADLLTKLAQSVGSTAATPMQESEPSIQELSDRERSVFRMLRSRLTLREIAGELYLSPNTVKTHTQSIYRKLGVSSRAEAVGLFPQSNLSRAS